MTAVDPTEFLVVGDVHDQWDDVDQRFVERGSQDLLIFVGDFGDENVALVRRIASLACAKVVVLGNHDAWFWSRRPADAKRVREQIAILGADHLAFRSRVIGRLAVVGGRPFSWGGTAMRDRHICDDLYGIAPSDEASAGRILAACAEVPDVPLVLVAHNGPFGLGEGPAGIFGCDFREPHVDFGDHDLALALRRLREAGRTVLVTVAGHMHESLRGGGLRERAVSDGATLHLNAAVVPRHVRRASGGLQRHFLRVRLGALGIASADDLWIDDTGAIVASRSLLPARRIEDVGAASRAGRPPG